MSCVVFTIARYLMFSIYIRLKNAINIQKDYNLYKIIQKRLHKLYKIVQKDLNKIIKIDLYKIILNDLYKIIQKDLYKNC